MFDWFLTDFGRFLAYFWTFFGLLSAIKFCLPQRIRISAYVHQSAYGASAWPSIIHCHKLILDREGWEEGAHCDPCQLMQLTLFATGVITSPNYPANYPNYLRKTETIKVKDGLVVSLQFTAFDIEAEYDYDYETYDYDYESFTCPYDHLTITDGDGTTLMEKNCGNTLPTAITSTSNIVKLVFITDSSGWSTGWSLSWSAVTPGECQSMICLGCPE